MRTHSPNQTTVPWLTIGLVVTVLSLHCLPPAVALLEYRPDAFAAGQYWRLLTWHLVHWSNQHLLWDLIAFAILGTLAEQHSRRLTALALLGGALTISLAIPLIHPELPSCRGLSGVDCALFGLVWWQCLSTAWSQDDGPRTFLFALVGVGFLLKTLYEIRLGQALFAGDGFVPLPFAHLVGFGAGFLVAGSEQWRVGRSETMVEMT